MSSRRKLKAMEGTVLGGSNNFFEIDSDDGVLRLCSLKSKRLKDADGFYNPLAPGDRVEIETDQIECEKGQITKRLLRKNIFVRYNVKKRLPQVMAANLDCLLIVTTPSEPPFRPRFIDRAIAQAEFEGIEPVIVCNKSDLAEMSDIDLTSRLENWEDIGYRVFRTSTKNGDGLKELAEYIAGKTCALVGQSGIGKSSLVNALDESKNQKTSAISQKYERGTHTTTKGELMTLNLSGILERDATARAIDTPGVRRFVLHDIPSADLALYFRDFRDYIGKCTFGMSCTHRGERGCKIQEAVYAGIISEERYESWLRICEEIDSGSWED